MATSGKPTFKKAEFVEKEKERGIPEDEASDRYKAVGALTYGLPRSTTLRAATILMSLRAPTPKEAVDTMLGDYPIQGNPVPENLEAAKSVGCSLEDYKTVSIIAGAVEELFKEEGGGGGSSSSANTTGGRRKRRHHRMRGSGLKDSLVNLFRTCKGAASGAIDSIEGDIVRRLDAAAEFVSRPENVQRFASAIKTTFKIVASGFVVNDLSYGTDGMIGTIVVALCKAIEVVSPDAFKPLRIAVGGAQILSSIGLTAATIAPAGITAFIVGKIINDLYSRSRERLAVVNPQDAHTYYDVLMDILNRNLVAGGRQLYTILNANLNSDDEADEVNQQMTDVLALARTDPRRQAAIAAFAATSLPERGSGAMEEGGRRRTKKHHRHRRHHRKTLKRV